MARCVEDKAYQARLLASLYYGVSFTVITYHFKLDEYYGTSSIAICVRIVDVPHTDIFQHEIFVQHVDPSIKPLLHYFC